MGVVAIFCNRDNSTRKPGKWATDIAGASLMERIVRRLTLARCISKIVIAVPDGPAAGAIPKFAADHGLPIVYGPENDVVARFGKAVDHYVEDGDYVFRVMADQPFLDWRSLDFAASVMQAKQWDFLLPLTFDRDPVYGAGLSPWSQRAWSWIASRSKNEEREHVGMCLRRNVREFVYGLVDLPHWAYRPYRLEMDTDADLVLANSILARWRDAKGEDEPSLQWVVDLLDRNRDLSMLNSSIQEKTGPYTSFTVAEISGWEKDYTGRPVVFQDLPSAIGIVETKSATCRNCGGMLVTVRLGSKRVKFRCAVCGQEQTYTA